MNRVLGIDPGIETTGYGILEENHRDQTVIAYGVISSPSQELFYNRLAYLYQGIIQVIRDYQITEMAVEEAFFSKNAHSTLVLGQARGVILLAGAHENCHCFEYSPRKIKSAVVGNGSASKEQVQYMIKSILKIQDALSNYDISDALAVALCHLNQNRN